MSDLITGEILTEALQQLEADAEKALDEMRAKGISESDEEFSAAAITVGVDATNPEAIAAISAFVLPEVQELAETIHKATTGKHVDLRDVIGTTYVRAMTVGFRAGRLAAERGV